jgi:hypothetical protein
MEFQSDEMTSYLHRPTGRVIVVSNEAMRAAEQGDGVETWVEQAELADARRILAGGHDYLPLPDRYEIDEYRMMERFAARIPDASRRDEVLDAVQRRGAFRNFKDTVKRLGLADEWYRYRDGAYEDVARAWCDAHDIPLDPSAVADA